MTKMTIWAVTIIIVFLGIFFGLTSFYIVEQTQQAVVLRFGEIKNVRTEPGVYLKAPFIDNVVKFEKRFMIYDIPVERVITFDRRTVLADTYAIWRIEDPKRFIETLGTMEVAMTRIDDIVYSHVRDVIGTYSFSEVLSIQRLKILEEIKKRSVNSLKDFGISIIDVRLKRTDLPQENTQAVYERMKSERYAMAAQLRAEGEKEAQKMKAEADKKVSIIKSDAQKEAEIIRGTGEASATNIYSEAYSQDMDFYELQKITQIYKESFEKSILVIPNDSPLLKYFYNMK
ncbi:MAG TPA: protease modulator HflC [Defluviitoga tunisiensis]|nr:protease modulator HflC [Defluviitoga tunisiensis]HOB55542.1 protease modulator HflC [Defluviitoga tunisiensis]HOP34460.1 protease modulator HflC [Defluviitoga tunisiensis]HPZ66765.1 protease modulator HflC [Defluviitoga tunisiensis]HQD43481.1 protease modulator HflC [Defluviitoga tunisiensis]